MKYRWIVYDRKFNPIVSGTYNDLSVAKENGELFRKREKYASVEFVQVVE